MNRVRILLRPEQRAYLLNLIHAEQQFDEESRHVNEADSGERESCEAVLTLAWPASAESLRRSIYDICANYAVDDRARAAFIALINRAYGVEP